MNATFQPGRLGLALATTLLLGGPASAASVVYQVSGTMTATNALALTLRDLAGFQRSGNNIPFQARIEFDTAAPPIVVSDTASFQNYSFDSAVTRISVSIGGFDFQTVRGLYTAPRGSFEASWNEGRTDVSNTVSAAGIDQFVTETTDRSATPLFPGPKQAMFNAYSQPISLVTGGVAYNSLNFRAADTRLYFSGFNLFGAATVPTGIPAGDLVMASFTLGMTAQFSGPGGASFTGKANYLAQDFSYSVTTVPEPATWMLALAGVLAVAGLARRRGARR